MMGFYNNIRLLLDAYHQPANDFVRSFLCRHIDDIVETAKQLTKP